MYDSSFIGSSLCSELIFLWTRTEFFLIPSTIYSCSGLLVLSIHSLNTDGVKYLFVFCNRGCILLSMYILFKIAVRSGLTSGTFTNCWKHTLNIVLYLYRSFLRIQLFAQMDLKSIRLWWSEAQVFTSCGRAAATRAILRAHSWISLLTSCPWCLLGPESTGMLPLMVEKQVCRPPAVHRSIYSICQSGFVEIIYDLKRF